MWYLSQNFTLGMTEQKDISINQWQDKVLSKGAYGFSKESVQKELTSFSDIAIKRALSRLSSKGKILSLYKGYYLIIPPQYTTKGILPPQLYLDAFMKYLQRPYYVALLNAAAYHGASHQQPQEYFVVTDFPVLRPIQKRSLKINYISIKEIPNSLIEKRKTEAGYLNISNAALTACDLIQFEKRIGGISRAATVLNELIEVINPADFSPTLLKHVHVTTMQRLGYLLEHVCFNQELADTLFGAMQREKLGFFRIPLKAANETKGFASDHRWKVIVNTEIEIDE
jgi:predicted transcriptional regulator of viral defense system